MISNTCMVTGHKKIDPAKTEQVQQALRREILAAIDDGCTHFISGFDQGVGLIFASIVVELKQSRPITLEAAIPYRNRIHTKIENFNGCLLPVISLASTQKNTAPPVMQSVTTIW